MGGSRSSSKRKSSKKKGSKISPKALRKRKSRRPKSKKLRHLDDSSSCSDDYSSSSASVSSSTSDDKYSRARSRTRRDANSSRKRSRRSPSSESCSQDSRHRKKVKVSKRSSMSGKRKKSQKKRRRDPSVSLTGSDSQSCSPCRACSSSENEGEFKRHRDRYTEKTKYVKDLSKAKSGRRERKTAYVSCSSCSQYSDDGSYGSKDMMPIEENPKRLRSVITVAKSPGEEETKWHKDGHDTEIVHDPNDCPTSRDNHSNDMGSKRETINQSQVCSDGRVVNMAHEGVFAYGINMTDLAKAGERAGFLDSQGNSHSGEAVANNSSKEKEGGVMLTAGGASNDDLESILRLKALENLRKYRGGLQKFAKPPADEKNRRDGDLKQKFVKPPADEKNRRDGNLKQLSTAKVEFVESRSLKEDGSGVTSVDAVLDQSPKPTVGRVFSSSTSYEQKFQQEEVVTTGSGRSSSSVVCKPDQGLISSSSNAENISPAYANINKSKMGKSALGQESLGNNSVVKQLHEANIKLTESNVNKGSDIKAKIVQSSNSDGVGVNNVNESDTGEPSSLKPTTEQHISKKQPDEDKDRSQFEQKTMSVMRGGEMVQVSYKVYIPKKAPALARRHLRR